jgi:hypothetical protein
MHHLVDQSISMQGLKLLTTGYYEQLEELYGVKIYNNQRNVYDAITNPLNHFVNVIQCRGGGKTFSVGLSLHDICRSIPNSRWGIFAPKFTQAKNDLEQIMEIDGKIKLIDNKSSSTTRIQFKNGSTINADSANEYAEIEGQHFMGIYCEECHRISDSALSNKIIPMLGSFKRRQLIKAGVALYKNNFRESCLSPDDIVIASDWLHCDILKQSGIIKYKGIEYPQSVVSLMPWSIKLQIFGDMAHKLGKGGKLSEIDFITQYQLIWQEQVGQYLSRAQQELLKSGTHKELTETDNVGLFFFGLDTASGTMRLDRDGLDDTALSIWRLFNGELQKVYCQAWQLTPLEEYQEILAALKRFRPKFGYIDFSNTAIAFLDMLKRDGISCEGITYAMKDSISGKNNRQAMLDNFSSLLTLGKVKYPKIFGNDGKILVSPDMYKSYIQWTILQRKITGTSERIEAPDDDHDDFVFSDVQCVFATSKYFDFINTSTTTSSIPFAGSRGGMMSRNQR